MAEIIEQVWPARKARKWWGGGGGGGVGQRFVAEQKAMTKMAETIEQVCVRGRGETGQ
jgi:hypothetical protein